MDLRKQLLIEHSKMNALLIRDYLLENPEKLDELIEIFLKNEPKVSQRAAMVVSVYFDADPKALTPYLETMIDALSKDDHHSAIKRVCLRILQFVEVPENKMPALIDHSIKFVNDPKEGIAIKAFSMSILKNCCMRYPDLKTEVIPLVEEIISHDSSAGIQNRGKKVLSSLMTFF